MGHLLDALQEYTAAEHAAFKREDVDLSLLADWIGAELQDAAPGRAARIEVDPGLTVQGDAHYLKRMLAQLLDNAWKFSAPRERAEIRVEGERAGDALHLRVRDAGIGFDMQYAGRLFAPFQRLHGPDAGAGAGLGLAIAQCIARRHGGRIRAESAPGQGSVFHVELPLAQPQEENADGHADG
jgi:signal transduction histidine kinase